MSKSKAAVKIVYEQKTEDLEILSKHSLEKDVIPMACSKCNCPSVPGVKWMLRNADTGRYVKQSDLENELDQLKGARLTLKRDPKVEAQETIAKLAETEKNKMALYMLFKTYLNDEVFVEEFFALDGLKALINAMLSTTGSTQALTLRCLVAALENSSAGKLQADVIDEDVLAVILELCASDTITTQKSALQLAAAVTSADGLSIAVDNSVQKAAQKLQLENGWEILVSKGLQSDDIDCAKYALMAINAIAMKQGDDVLEKLDDECGLLKAVAQRCLHVQHFRDPLVTQQQLRLKHIEQDRTTQYDGSKAEHVSLLKEMWGFVFPDSKYPGDKGEHWDQLGFQGKDPATDLRGAGLMGLKTLHYMAEFYPEVLRKICSEQAGKSVEDAYYPVATAGINVSALLHEKLYKSTQVLPFLFDQSYAFEEIYCATMKLVDATFHRVHSTYMEFTSKVVPAVRAHLDKVLATKPTTVDLIKELLEADDQDLERRIDGAKAELGKGGSTSSSSEAAAASKSSLPEEKFELKATPENLKRTIAHVQSMTVEFVRKCKVDHMKRGCLVQWVKASATGAVASKRPNVPSPLSKSMSNIAPAVVLVPEEVFLRLSKNEQDLEWGVAKVQGVTPPLPNSISLSLFEDVVCGAGCPLLKNARARDTEDFRDKCIELVAAAAPQDNPSVSTKQKPVCFYVDEMVNFAMFVDALKALFNKNMVMADEDTRALVAAQMTKRMFDLEGVSFDPNPPPVPSKPIQYNFATK